MSVSHTSRVDSAPSATLRSHDVWLWALALAAAVLAAERWGTAGAVAAGLAAAGVGAVAAARAAWPLLVAALGTAGAGAVHLAVATPHLREWWGYGVFFVASGLVQLGWSAVAPRRAERRLLWLGLAGNLAVVALWVITRTAGLPFGPDPGEAERVGTPDALASALELLAAGACAVALARALPPAGRLRLPLTLAAAAATAVARRATGAHG